MNRLAKELLRIADALKVAVDPIKGLSGVGLLPRQHSTSDKGTTKHDSISRFYRDTGGDIRVDDDYDVMKTDFAAPAFFEELHPVGGNNSATVGHIPMTDQDLIDQTAKVINETDEEYQAALGYLHTELVEFAQVVKKLALYREYEVRQLQTMIGDLQAVPQWLEDQDYDYKEYAVLVGQFEQMAKELNSYLSIIDFNYNKSKKLYIIIDNVAMRFTKVDSAARPGVLQALEKLSKEELAQGKTKATDIDDEMRLVPFNMNMNPKIKAEVNNLVSRFKTKVQKRLARVQYANNAIHDIRVAHVDSLTGDKVYLKRFEFLIRNKNEDIGSYAARLLGLGYQRRKSPSQSKPTNLLKPTKDTISDETVVVEEDGSKTASRHISAGFWGDMWESIKSGVTKFVAKVKDMLSGWWKQLVHGKELNDESFKLMGQLESLVKDLESDEL